MNKSFLDIMSNIDDAKFDIIPDSPKETPKGNYRLFVQSTVGKHFEATGVAVTHNSIKTTWKSKVAINNDYHSLDCIFLVNPENIILATQPMQYVAHPHENIPIWIIIEWGKYSIEELKNQARKITFHRSYASINKILHFSPVLTIKDLERLKII